MKALGLDLGDASLGIAISDREKMIARGVENLRFEQGDWQTPLNKVKALVAKEPIDVIVLGHPKNMDGTSGKQAKTAETFKKLLEKSVDVTIVLYDERLTTKMAQGQMQRSLRARKKRQLRLDEESAVVLLQNYLDGKKE